MVIGDLVSINSEDILNSFLIDLITLDLEIFPVYIISASYFIASFALWIRNSGVIDSTSFTVDLLKKGDFLPHNT